MRLRSAVPGAGTAGPWASRGSASRCSHALQVLTSAALAARSLKLGAQGPCLGAEERDKRKK